jgi:putative tryptophan/tyrosine transport system substrate-binding protein
MRRREFITLIGGGAAAWPLAAHAQQRAMPVIGFLNGTDPDTFSHWLTGFRDGLQSAGYVEGQNVAVEYRWAENQYDRLPALAADLVKRQVNVIVAGGAPISALTAKAATTTIPIVFGVGADPVAIGLVPSLNRPVGNITGVSFLVNNLGAKRLGLLHELLPGATVIGFLVDPRNPNAEPETIDMQEAADTLGRQLIILQASTASEVEAAFASFAARHVQALIIAAEIFFLGQREQLATLAARYRLPTMYHLREIVMAGGLMSYGTDVADAFRQVGIYVGRVLKGEKPADLPVIESTKFEFVINFNAAKALGLTIPPGLLSIADEVIK